MYRWHRVYKKSQYLLLNFAVNLKWTKNNIYSLENPSHLHSERGSRVGDEAVLGSGQGRQAREESGCREGLGAGSQSHQRALMSPPDTLNWGTESQLHRMGAVV